MSTRNLLHHVFVLSLHLRTPKPIPMPENLKGGGWQVRSLVELRSTTIYIHSECKNCIVINILPYIHIPLYIYPYIYPYIYTLIYIPYIHIPLLRVRRGIRTTDLYCLMGCVAFSMPFLWPSWPSLSCASRRGAETVLNLRPLKQHWIKERFGDKMFFSFFCRYNIKNLKGWGWVFFS
jgi:hypothetical protein